MLQPCTASARIQAENNILNEKTQTQKVTYCKYKHEIFIIDKSIETNHIGDCQGLWDGGTRMTA